MQQGDEDTKELMKIGENSCKTPYQQGLVKDYKISGGILYRNVNNRLLFVVPKAMRKGIVITAHDFGGHFSLERTIDKILQDF